jgi:hypothetical protein
MNVTRVLLGLLLVATTGTASASEITAFVSKATPDGVWAAGAGGAVSISFFSILNFEGEIARQSAELEGSKMYSLTGSVLIAPPTGKLVPYAGLGVGAFRQETGARSDNGTLSALIAGLKLKLGPIFVVKGEYRRIGLSGEPLFEIENRFSVGAGLSF